VSDPKVSELGLVHLEAMSRPPAVVSTATQAPSFEAVYRAHAKTVSRWACHLLGSSEDCKDVVQDVFLVVRRKLPAFKADAEVTTWLYEITVRVVQDFRKRRRWWSWLTGRGQSPSRGKVRAELPPQVATVQEPEAVLEARERVRLVYRILDELGETHRTTFLLFELEGLSGEHIAKIMGTSVAAVWVHLHRARRKFVERLRELEAKEEP